jgi:glycerol-3-phosphate cytidylyltransferase-like family protein
MVLKTIDVGFANITIEVLDDCCKHGYEDIVIGLTDKKTNEYLQDIAVIRKNEEKDAINAYIYADETTENYTHKFEIKPYKES